MNEMAEMLAKETEADLHWSASRSWRLRFAVGLWGTEGEHAPVITRTEMRRQGWPNPPVAVDVSYRVEYVDIEHAISNALGANLQSANWKVNVGFWCHRLTKGGILAANVNSGAIWFRPAEALSTVTMPDEMREFIRKHQYATSTLRLIERVERVD